mmetsp:Transcript_8929/g.17257  ORF Transcript_8929/g.17257 Transcript_8929/m.17257 type:complete len:161 (+) Transcript_8929:2769-3251(+)
MESHNSGLKECLNHIYFSSGCRFFYLILILASVAVCAWTLVHFGSFPDEGWFIVLEITLTLAVIVEVALRIYLQGTRTFLMNWTNLFDLAVLFCFVIAIIGAVITKGVLGEVGGLSGQALLVFYCSVQYLRLALFLKNRTFTHVEDLEILPRYSQRMSLE